MLLSRLSSSLSRTSLPLKLTSASVLSLSLYYATLGSSSSRTMSSAAQSLPKALPESEWQAKLTKEQFRILRGKGTEAAGTGEYDKHFPKEGTYACAGCGTPLYTAGTKFNSGCGWPAFFDAIPGAVTQHVDSSFGMKRIEITCSACGGHLGHLFKGEGYNNPTDERACVNSVSIKFNPADEAK